MTARGTAGPFAGNDDDEYTQTVIYSTTELYFETLHYIAFVVIVGFQAARLNNDDVTTDLSLSVLPSPISPPANEIPSFSPRRRTGRSIAAIGGYKNDGGGGRS